MHMLGRKLGARRRYSQSFSSGRIITLHHFFIFWILGPTYNYHFLAGFILTLCLNLLTFFESLSQFFGVLRMEKVTAADIFLWFLEEEEKDFSGGGGARWWAYYSHNNSVFPPLRAPNRTLKLASMKYSLFSFTNLLVVCNFYDIIIMILNNLKKMKKIRNK